MTEITVAAPSVLDCLAGEARYYSEAAANNLFQLARVLTEAKKLVQHGQWGSWVERNAGCSERTAQQMMQAYVRYGDKPEVQRLDRSKVFKLLSLPEEIEEEFFDAHDVSDMTAREVAEAVREAVEEAELKAKLKLADARRAMNIVENDASQQRRRAEKAEAELKRIMKDPPLPEDVAEQIATANREREDLRAELERVSSAAQDTLNEANALRRERSTLQGIIAGLDADLQKADAECERLKEDLQSAQMHDPDPETEKRMQMLAAAMGQLDLREKKLHTEYIAEMEQLRVERMELLEEWRALEK